MKNTQKTIKMKKNLVLIVMSSLLFFACSKKSITEQIEHVLTTPENIIPTTPETPTITENIAFSNHRLENCNLPIRYGFKMIKFKGEYWFMGGMNYLSSSSYIYYNDIWKSNDGEHWTQVNNEANWGKRSDFNLFIFKNKLWIIGGINKNKSEFINDVWSSEDGEHWTEITPHGSWQTRESMSASVHNEKIYIIGGQSTTNWHIYQDIWESSNGKDWNKVGSISDDKIGGDEARDGIQEQSILKLKDTYYMLGGEISSIFSAFTRVLQSQDMIHWEVTTTETPWKEFSYYNLHNLCPFVYKGNLVFIATRGLIQVAKTGNILKDYLPNKQFLFSSKDGKIWNTTFEMPSFKNGQFSEYIRKPRVLIINDEIHLYGIFKSIEDSSKSNHIYHIKLIP
jgi:hypothetical protein